MTESQQMEKMKRIYSAQNITMVGLVQNILENNDIPCVIRNQFLSVAAGELPPIETWPELWIADDSQYEQAKEIVDAILKEEGAEKDPWVCAKCSEKIEGQFTECWKCGSSRAGRGITV